MTDLLELFIDDQEGPLARASDQALDSPAAASRRSRVLARRATQTGYTLLGGVIGGGLTAAPLISATQTGTSDLSRGSYRLSPAAGAYQMVGAPAQIALPHRVEGVGQAPVLVQAAHHAGILVHERLWAVHKASAPIAPVGFGTYISAGLSSTCDVNDVRTALGPVGGRVAMALLHAKDEIFEYGTESQLAQTLSALMADYGVIAVSAIGDAFASPVMTDEIASETLRSLGAANDPRTRTDRIRVLAQQLRSESPRRRYAAAVGLADTNTPEAIALLREAIELEPMEELKRRFRRFIALLGP